VSIHVALSHITHYRYDRLVNLGPQVVRLRPAPHSRSRVLSYSLKVEPQKHFINWQQDPFANHQARLVFPDPTRELKVTVDLIVEMAVYNPFDFFLEPHAEQIPFRYEAAQAQELAPYLATQPLTPLLKAYLAGIDRKARPAVDFLVALNQRLQQDITYLIRMEPGVQTPEQTLQLRSGSCRDSSWLLVQLLRHLGLAARFVSGYLIQLKADVKALDGPSGTDVDFTDLHAWCEVFLPGAGWVGLDPTSGLFAGEGHIPLACTPEPSSAAPIEGAIERCEVEFSHHMGVTRVHESARVTQPYTDAQWAEVLALGQGVDQDLKDHDVRLTMGGEPTFVATENRDAPEWNVDALGPTKRRYATELVHKLRAQYGDGGFLHFGQGKWYPGEPLPRWALSIYWRKDGQKAWQDPTLFASESQTEHCNYSSEDARRFTQTLAKNLGLDGRHIAAGYEDTFYYLWRERRLPVNVDPFASKLDDAMERERLRRIFSQGLQAEIGYVLPLQAQDPSLLQGGPRWLSGPWFFRDERMYLLPGDSPMGFRLPLDALPWLSETDRLQSFEIDPFAPREPLASPAKLVTQVPAAGSGLATGLAGDRAPGQADPRLTATAGRAHGIDAAQQAGTGSATQAGNSAGADTQDASQSASQDANQSDPARAPSLATRTALCVEVRDPVRAHGPSAKVQVEQRQSQGERGTLYVFMPPLSRLEDYLALLEAVEATARELDVRIVLEGYAPPRDARLQMLQVTPDPGVIEVNIHPAHNWGELVEHTEFLYQAAHETRLAAEKFMTDGRHTGTGGGNHFVLGAATPADSPFLRKPELLGSLIAHWHNHPSLSYLFSGLFIGPTSQAPRVDEARNDQLRELEIALQQIAQQRQQHGQQMPPWLVDRTLRNILVDVTGNTHRSEFCIDKLYSPDSSTGRLGLLELRAFEMPPHARMSIVQQLLLRALVSRFWQKPTQPRLSRWGTALHDRFMLPTFVRMDLEDVLHELAEFGYNFLMEWFEPHLEFRFPLIGQVHHRGITLSLRTALEPWHVMGEEGSAGGTVRYVDSSLERIEVRLQGLNRERYVITVNGKPLPLQNTGTVGDYVAGVRFKAWNPPSALHPSIGVHAPLTFDIVDTWNQRSLGGCQYHVAHPGGRNYDALPVNSYEAEARRLMRFFQTGHTPGAMVLPPEQLSQEYPVTLDLRAQR